MKCIINSGGEQEGMVLRRPLMMIAKEDVWLLLLMESKSLVYALRPEVLPRIAPADSIVNNIGKNAVIDGEILFKLRFQLAQCEILIFPSPAFGEVFRFNRIAAGAKRAKLRAGEMPCSPAKVFGVSH